MSVCILSLKITCLSRLESLNIAAAWEQKLIIGPTVHQLDRCPLLQKEFQLKAKRVFSVQYMTQINEIIIKIYSYSTFS